MMALSALPIGMPGGSSPLIDSVWRKRRPPATSDSLRLRGRPSVIGPPARFTSSSRKRLVWRALRAASDMPVLCASSSSSVTIGRNRSCSSKRNRLVGSCMRTLVSTTKSFVVEVFRAGGAERGDFRAIAVESVAESVGGESVSGVSEERVESNDGPSGFFNKIQYLLRVTGYFHTAPLPADGAVTVQHEGAALDAAHLPAVHVLHLDDAEKAAGLLFLVREEFERKAHLGLEVLVGFQAVARDAVDLGVGLAEFLVKVAEARAFGGAARGVVLGIEVQHQSGAGFRQAEGLAACAWQGEVPYLGAHQR